ncbi:uncharacterized protein LOC141640786 [Silene latifolia]|uniref:uncharacterized protein LOC141640786 n=1 Tax=Silene latifolia TaxID=37657 RepID=UPI003D771027
MSSVSEFQKLFIQLDGSPLSKIHALKDFGNSLFRQHQFDFAGDCYDKACRQLCVNLKDRNYFDLNSTVSLAISLCLNLAACSIKLRAFDGALIICSMVLTFFPNNSKALFRKAVALRNLNRISEACVILKEAQALEPHNKDIIRELNEVCSPRD